jgi:hypothetical protein
MTWRDKFEPGSKEDAADRKDHLPTSQVQKPEIPSGPDPSPEIPRARGGGTRKRISHPEDDNGAAGYVGVSADERMARLRRWLAGALNS